MAEELLRAMLFCSEIGEFFKLLQSTTTGCTKQTFVTTRGKKEARGERERQMDRDRQQRPTIVEFSSYHEACMGWHGGAPRSLCPFHRLVSGFGLRTLRLRSVIRSLSTVHTAVVRGRKKLATCYCIAAAVARSHTCRTSKGSPGLDAEKQWSRH